MPNPSKMAGLTNVADLRAEKPRDEKAIAAYRAEILTEILLTELREERGVTQAAIAERLQTSRPNVSRIEHEDDVRLSTLTRYVGAMGGRVRVIAEFDDGMTRDLLAES